MIRNAIGASVLLAVAAVPRAGQATCTVSLTSQSGSAYVVNVNGLNYTFVVEQISSNGFDTSIIIGDEQDIQWLTGTATYNSGSLDLETDRVYSGGSADLLVGSTSSSPIVTSWSTADDGELQGAEGALMALAYALEDFYSDAQSADMAAEIEDWVEVEGCD